jgi:hypothetical protein
VPDLPSFTASGRDGSSAVLRERGRGAVRTRRQDHRRATCALEDSKLTHYLGYSEPKPDTTAAFSSGASRHYAAVTSQFQNASRPHRAICKARRRRSPSAGARGAAARMRRRPSGPLPTQDRSQKMIRWSRSRRVRTGRAPASDRSVGVGVLHPRFHRPGCPQSTEFNATNQDRR